jgi:hypothetical protein
MSGCVTHSMSYDEMELWQWNEVQHNRWTRALKACNQVGVRPLWHVDEQEHEVNKLSWATATRMLRELKARIIRVGGKREQPKEQAEIFFRFFEILKRRRGLRLRPLFSYTPHASSPRLAPLSLLPSHLHHISCCFSSGASAGPQDPSPQSLAVNPQVYSLKPKAKSSKPQVAHARSSTLKAN